MRAGSKLCYDRVTFSARLTQANGSLHCDISRPLLTCKYGHGALAWVPVPGPLSGTGDLGERLGA